MRRSHYVPRLYAGCFWPEAFWPVLAEADANDLPSDLADDVKYYFDVGFKIEYALSHGTQYSQDIP